MNIYIDTRESIKATVGIELHGKRKIKTSEIVKLKSQAVLPMIEELLHEEHKPLQDISGITVETGPGSFTGLRVGVAIANTLAALLKVSVNNRPVGELVEPIYS